MIRYNKRKLWLFIIKDVNYIIHNLKILSVLNSLLNELVKDLIAGNEINIPNLGLFKINNLQKKRIKNIATGAISFRNSSKILRFKISRKLSKFIKGMNI